MIADPADAILRRAADRYEGTGVVSRRFARGKLTGDPLYRALLSSRILGGGRLLVEAGCGQGLALAALAECRRGAVEGRSPDDGPPPVFQQLLGIELRPRIAALARLALGADAEIVVGDAGAHLPASASAVLLLDVLHLMPAAAQEALIGRAAAALEPDGVLLLREADASAGAGFHAVRLGNRLKALAVGNLRQRFHFRSAAEWRARLEREGLAVHLQPMAAGTPFSNVLLVGRRAP